MAGPPLGTSNFNPDWEKHPFLLMVVFFILGVGISDIYDFQPEVLGIATVLYFGLLLWFEKKLWISVNLLFYKTLAVCLGILLAGMLRYEMDKPDNRPDHVLNFIDQDKKNIQIEGTVTQIDQGGNSWKVFMNVSKICQTHCYDIRTKTIVYVQGDLNIDELDEVKLRGTLLPKRTPNFKAFDYNKYLERKGIHFTLFTKSSPINIEFMGKSGVWSNPVIRFKSKLIKNIDNNIHDDLINGLCKAMFLGDRSDVDDDTIKLFSHTGAIHILAVSGMHVGIIMGFIIWLTGLIKSKKPVWKSIRTFIIIGFTIVFILLTGATPSVLRAGLLFIILYLTKDNVDKLSSLNVLGLVALIILVYDPVQVLTLSFQFSFTAVLSILLFNSWVTGWIKSENKWVKKIWAFFAVSFSVQILMAPLIIYYFGFYTTWFFINNLAAIPMVYIGIFGSVLVSFFSFISNEAASFTGKIVTEIMGRLYDLLAIMNQLPFGLIDQISWTSIDLILVYFIIFSMIVFIKFRHSFYMKSLIFGLAFLVFSFSFTAFKNVLSSEVVFYSVSKGYMIDIFDGNRLYTLKNNQLDKVSEEYSSSAYRRSKHNIHPIYASMEDISEQTDLLTGKNIFQYKSIIFLKMLPGDTRNLNEANFVILDRNIYPKDLTLLSKYDGEVILLNEVRQKTKDAISLLKNKNFILTDISKTGSYSILLKR